METAESICHMPRIKKTKQWSCSVTGTFETCSYYKEYFQNVGFFTKRHPDEKIIILIVLVVEIE